MRGELTGRWKNQGIVDDRIGLGLSLLWGFFFSCFFLFFFFQFIIFFFFFFFFLKAEIQALWAMRVRA